MEAGYHVVHLHAGDESCEALCVAMATALKGDAADAVAVNGDVNTA